jgi:hypothetical protein
MEHATLQARLAALQGEFSTGRQLLAEHEAKAAAVREQLLRISGAMKVLTELLEQDLVAAGGPAVAVET